MYGLMVVLFLLVCLGLVISILLQSAKGEGLAGAFGGSSLTGTVFGGRGAATFLTRATTYLGAAFMLMAIALSFLHPTTGRSTAVQGSSAVEEAARENPAPPLTPPAQTQPAAADGNPQPGQQQPAAGTDQSSDVDEIFQGQDQSTQAQPTEAPGDSG